MDTLNKIIALLKKQGKNQKSLCEALGLNQQAFTNWKTGQNESYRKHLPEIAAYLGVTVGELLGEAPPGMDDFTYAMQAECAELTDEDKEILLGLARRLAERRRGHD